MAALLLACTVAWLGRDAAASTPDDLLQLLHQGTAGQRLAAAQDLAKISATEVASLVARLARPRRSSEEERLAVLGQIGAAVPDEMDRFHIPGRATKADDFAADEVDWLQALVALPPRTPGLGDVIADVALVRALAASRDLTAATAILEFAFDDVGRIYRDECGRSLREMEPYSLPTLIRSSYAGAKARLGRQERQRRLAMSRYANYQLDRLDRQDAGKSLAAASEDDELVVAILRAYGATRYRRAVRPVFAMTNHASRTMRREARAAFLRYVTGPEPPPPPKRKLKLAGGKETEEEMPLWLTSRELAAIELENAYRQLFRRPPPKRLTLRRQSEKIFARYDADRRAAIDGEFARGDELLRAGDPIAAAGLFDPILAREPEYPRRAAMAPAFFARGEKLERERQWRRAAEDYRKASALDPDPKRAKMALMLHHAALERSREAERRAREKERAAEIAAAKAAATQTAAPAGGAENRWMLYAGIAGVAGAMILFAVGFFQRRRPST